MRRGIRLGLGLAGLLAVPVLGELRFTRTLQPLTQTWQSMPVESRRTASIGVSLRAPQIDAFNLDPRGTFETLLKYPFQVLRLGAYWNRLEPRPGVFDPGELDWQIEAAERAGKQVVMCVGALKCFGYPEFFAPHHIVESLPERRRILARDYPALLDAATDFIRRIVERYRQSPSILAWQVEHESVDPLGLEHSWRLDLGFVEREVAAVRAEDPGRPVLMNGFLPVSIVGGLSQWFQTRDQGDSIAAAVRTADVIGIDFYPRMGLLAVGSLSAYLDSACAPWQFRTFDSVLRTGQRLGKRVMITEIQAEPWETDTIPPNPPGRVPASCRPEHLIANYNALVRRATRSGAAVEAYLFWGAEYWLLRQQVGDRSYLDAFARVLDTP